MTCRGHTPLDVATAVIRDNHELCLSLEDSHLEHVVSLLVATTTCETGCSQERAEEVRKGVSMGTVTLGSMTCEWAPNGGEKCLDFLQSAVWADGTSVQYMGLCIVGENC